MKFYHRCIKKFHKLPVGTYIKLKTNTFKTKKNKKAFRSEESLSGIKKYDLGVNLNAPKV